MTFPEKDLGMLPNRHWASMAFTTLGRSLTHAGKGPKNYVRSDQRLYEDVCEQLTEHHEIDAGDIEVLVQNGEVTLTGSVRSKQDKHLAEDIAAAVKGVHDVINQLKILEGPAAMLDSLSRSGVTAIF